MTGSVTQVRLKKKQQTGLRVSFKRGRPISSTEPVVRACFGAHDTSQTPSFVTRLGFAECAIILQQLPADATRHQRQLPKKSWIHLSLFSGTAARSRRERDRFKNHVRVDVTALSIHATRFGLTGAGRGTELLTADRSDGCSSPYGQSHVRLRLTASFMVLHIWL